MSRLTSYSTPAERARGCVFADRFETEADVNENNGIAINSPIFSQNGVILNGTNQRLDYDISTDELNHNQLSFIIEFTPYFDWNENIRRSISDTLNGSGRCHITKMGASDNYVLSHVLGDVLIANISANTYSRYWMINQKNILVISSTSGNNNIWLNGNKILNANGTVWAQNRRTPLRIGSQYNGLDRFFHGIYHSFMVFKKMLSQEESIGYYNNTIYKYLDSAIGIWQFRQEDHDPANARTIDSSGNNNHFIFGDGVTPATYPTKLIERHGYYFNSDYMEIQDLGLNVPGVTIAIEMDGFFDPADGVAHYLLDSFGTRLSIFKDNTNQLVIRVGGTNISIPLATYQSAFVQNGRNILILSMYSGNNNGWLNGFKFLDSNATVWTPGDVGMVRLGMDNAGANAWNANIYKLIIIPNAIYEIQSYDLLYSMIYSINMR